jgi:hypothetical protein
MIKFVRTLNIPDSTWITFIRLITALKHFIQSENTYSMLNKTKLNLQVPTGESDIYVTGIIYRPLITYRYFIVFDYD